MSRANLNIQVWARSVNDVDGRWFKISFFRGFTSGTVSKQLTFTRPFLFETISALDRDFNIFTQACATFVRDFIGVYFKIFLRL